MDYFPMMARFNMWANERLFSAVATLSEEAYREDRKAFFGSVHATLNHILVVDRSWTGWIEGQDRRSHSLDQVLYDSFPDLQNARQEEDRHLITLIDGLDEKNLEQQIGFRATGHQHEGEAKVWQILVTVFNHQTHHRGQIHALLTQCGVDILPLDVICFLEEIGETIPPRSASGL